MIQIPTRIVGALVLACCTACSTVSHLEGIPPGTTLSIKGITATELPRTEDLRSKSVGNYEFVATAPDGQKLYGLLPLNVNGGTMAASILFFAPALFIGGFRDTFPFYQVDVDKQELRFKSIDTEAWRTYKPTAAESQRAKEVLEAPAGQR